MVEYTPRRKKKNKMSKAELGERVRIIRRHYGLTQSQFAQKINRTPGFISDIETGKSRISEQTIKAICFFSGVNKEWLLTGVGEMGCGDAADKAGIGKRIKEIRKENHLTQKEFADKIGYSERQIYCIETRKSNTSDAFIKKVSSTFSVNYSWIISGKGNKEIEKMKVREELIEWLENNPDVIRELEIRSGIEEK